MTRLSMPDVPIQRKIVAIIMIVTVAALLMASAQLLGYDFIQARRDLLNATTGTARIIADNSSAALAFEDRAAARDALNSLSVEPSIVAGCMYTHEGLFAEYVADGATHCPMDREPDGATNGFIVASRAIDLDGKRLGTVVLRATLAPTYARQRIEIAIVFGIVVFAALFALFLSSRLRQLVSNPILALADTANAVSRTEDYSIRAQKQGDDEVGKLAESFNKMLAHIQRREEELLNANRMKDEFLATVSHELRTPLNSVLGWTVLLREGKLSGDQQATALETVERNARLQVSLVDDLLDVSRIISGKLKMEFADVALRSLLESAVDSIRQSAEAKNLRLNLDIGRQDLTVRGDAFRLQQAIWNLLSNAIKFSPQGTSIDVRLDTVRGHARITVRDEGVGIQPEFLPYVFDRFRQADSSSTRPYGGLGLGLAIVRHITELHGGKVQVESGGPGKGSTFSIELPLKNT